MSALLKHKLRDCARIVSGILCHLWLLLLLKLWSYDLITPLYGDGAGNTIENWSNSRFFFQIQMH